jgi:acyl-CoA synthetase (AMP-forming)/AMP-acid ligase II
MPTLMLGATLVIATSEGHKDPMSVASLIRQHRVTSLVFTVPTLVRHPLVAPALASSHSSNPAPCMLPCTELAMQ